MFCVTIGDLNVAYTPLSLDSHDRRMTSLYTLYGVVGLVRLRISVLGRDKVLVVAHAGLIFRLVGYCELLGVSITTCSP